jgi:hypothetical protein
MTDLAQSVTDLTNNHRPMLRSELPAPQAQPATAPVARTQATEPLPDDNLLVLTGGEPQAVNLSVIAGVPMFWQQSSTPQLYTGVTWKPDVYALMITFAFVPPPGVMPTPQAPIVTELVPTTPVLWFSDTFSGSVGTSQMCCVPSILGEYHFDVMIGDRNGKKTRHRSVDPKIIVTPIIT